MVSKKNICSFCILLLILTGCGNDKCLGPQLNIDYLNTLKKNAFPITGAKGFLVLPNPLDATNNVTINVKDTRLIDYYSKINLIDLLNPMRLENYFLKIRISDFNDSPDILARPNTNGEYMFGVSDVHYSEVMAYYSLSVLYRYVEALGFELVKTRPLYVMVKANSSDPDELNAYYDHHYFEPHMPRTITMYGKSENSPALDRDIYWHEFGHFVVESASKEVGIDLATATGAIFTEGSSLHECLADALAESVGDKPYIGRWLAKNLDGYQPGEPLRSAITINGRELTFNDVIRVNKEIKVPFTYEVAEWCTRVLWQIRSKFIEKYGKEGSYYYERLIFSALSLLKRDTSFSQYRNALLESDFKLHCGNHKDDILRAFSEKGFQTEYPKLPGPLNFNSTVKTVESSSSNTFLVGFSTEISNPYNIIARNLRIILESSKTDIFNPIIYMQSYGDLEPGESITIGKDLGYEYSVMGEYVPNKSFGIRYRLRLMIENGPENIISGVLQ